MHVPFLSVLLTTIWVYPVNVIDIVRHSEKAPPLACTIVADATCPLGEVPNVSVTISNWSGKEIYLVGSLDASDCQWRFPYCYFEIIGPNGKSAVKGIGRCGVMNPLRERDFVKVSPGAKFDPYQKIDNHGFFRPYHEISTETFDAEGEYRLRFVYSTKNSNIAQWRGNEKLQALFDSVPMTTVSSNELTIKVVRAGK